MDNETVEQFLARGGKIRKIPAGVSGLDEERRKISKEKNIRKNSKPSQPQSLLTAIMNSLGDDDDSPLSPT